MAPVDKGLLAILVASREYEGLKRYAEALIEGWRAYQPSKAKGLEQYAMEAVERDGKIQGLMELFENLEKYATSE